MQKNTNMIDVYLGLGSNLGDREEILSEAIRNIDRRIGQVISYSPFYETKSEGFKSDHLFLNAVCHIRTGLAADEVLDLIQVIERELGRQSKSSNRVYADRNIDIDILLYGDEIVQMPHLQIPHPLMNERGFVLLPLADIASDVIHPVLKKTVRELKELWQQSVNKN